jgi:putative tricarboxylic transport membrane protein
VSNLMSAASSLFQVSALLWVLFGVALGFVIGLLPGFGSANAIAVLLPFSLLVGQTNGLIFILGIYAGAHFSGCVSGIVLNVPGHAAAAATALDGFPMQRRGEGLLAMSIARLSSMSAGVVAVIVAMLLINPLSQFGLLVGPPELFLITICAVTLVAVVAGKDTLKGLLSAAFGFLIAAMSADPITGTARMDFGFINLQQAIPVIPIFVGLFAISEMALIFRRPQTTKAGQLSHEARQKKRGTKGAAAEVYRRHPGVLGLGTAVGFGVGILPGLGSSIGNFASYGLAKRLSKTPERFGTGAPEGVIAAEAADSALVAGSMIPVLSLGIPGNESSALFLAAMTLHGYVAGPQFLSKNPVAVYVILLGLLVACVLLLPIGLLLNGLILRMARIPNAILVPFVLVICCVGVFAFENSFFDVWLALIFGVLGLLLRVNRYPLVPLVLGFILGPITEDNFSVSMATSHDSLSIFWTSNICRVLLFILVAMLAWSIRSAILKRRRRLAAAAADSRETEFPGMKGADA